MRLFTLVFAIAVIIASAALSVNAFVVPPTGICYVGTGENCLRCECKKPLKCYKAVCR
ncbi:hypothetical protein OESDEN_00542 [Oesophagostomum dentatum]|uniref:Uncharacterized protein n=1 Tax=Oesophagostomum dentatum TaxID=61180 RepID=A0A0B1TPH8_OESDE|nr:hypothetical protein OESDEN_00542 [Oesophagostomum dentatum]